MAGFAYTPRFSKRAHKILAIAWLVSFIPAMIWFRNSVPLLMFASWYANTVGHWSAWEGANANDPET